MTEIKNILIRMPNWLGDMVMATSFLEAVREAFPQAAMDLILKKELQSLAPNLPQHGNAYFFSKQDHSGLRGAYRFGKGIGREKKYDLFFCLPDSLSSAVMGRAINAKQNVGFRKGINIILLRETFKRKKNAHRTEEYIDLLSQYLKKEIRVPPVKLSANVQPKSNAVIININSEASSRRLPKEKAVSIIETIRRRTGNEIILIGSPKEKAHVDEVYGLLSDKSGIQNIAGTTTLPQLADLFKAAKATLSTDSGPAHVSNAVSTNTVILFGAGNENNTAPYNAANRTIIRLGKLSCEPCTNNVCHRYGTPKCLLELNEELITDSVIKMTIQ